MYNKILSGTQKPKLWQRSKEEFWDDEHISKSMLEMHLDPNLELASRKADTIKQSVEWLSTIIAPKSKILDLGCGPGLYTEKLSSLGYDVIGIDYSKRSIAYAKADSTNIMVNQYIVISEIMVKEYLIWNTMYDLQSLSAEMCKNSFKVRDKFDDVCGNLYTGKGENLCLIVSKQ